jgi:hypothetical protein
MQAHIDQAGSSLDASKRAFDNSSRLARKCYNGTIGTSTRLYIQYFKSLHGAYGIDNAVNGCLVDSFTKIRNTFEDGLHTWRVVETPKAFRAETLLALVKLEIV